MGSPLTVATMEVSDRGGEEQEMMPAKRDMMISKRMIIDITPYALKNIDYRMSNIERRRTEKYMNHNLDCATTSGVFISILPAFITQRYCPGARSRPHAMACSPGAAGIVHTVCP